MPRGDRSCLGLASVVRRPGPRAPRARRAHAAWPADRRGATEMSHLRGGVPVHRRQVTLGLSRCAEQHGAEDRGHRWWTCLEGDGGAATVGAHAGLVQLAGPSRRRRRRTSARVAGLVSGAPRAVLAVSEGLRSPVRATRTDPNLAGRGLGAHAYGARCLGLHLRTRLPSPGAAEHWLSGGRLGRVTPCEARRRRSRVRQLPG